jgi:hypothetical protein
VRYTTATWLDLGRERHEISRPTLDIHRLQWARAPGSGPMSTWRSREWKPVGPTFGPTSLFGSFESCL